MEVTLQEILDARENRVREQQRLLKEYAVPLICFTMNIAGPVKVSPLIRRGFAEGVALLEEKLPGEQVLYRHVEVLPTGCEAMFAVSMAAPELKALCTAIEEQHPLGRLFDMDVLDTDGTKLERESLRGCMVCGAPGRICASRRLHSVSQLQAVTREMLSRYFAQKDREQVAALAVQSLICEVCTTPKPGLVDGRNTGSHTDMDLALFVASAKALKPYFARCVQIGQETAADSPEETFSRLRTAGLAAEKAMYRATGGVNTHKGIIYTMGVLCGSIGKFWSPEIPIAPREDLLAECARLVKKAAEEDFAAVDGTTAGGRLYLQHGLRGIRGEVAEGLPSVANIGLPVYEKGLSLGLSLNDAGAATLLHLIANVEDTTLYHRGGREGAAWAAEAAKALLQKKAYPDLEQIERLDDAFIQRNLSPGGCADLLAVTYFLHSLQKFVEDQVQSLPVISGYIMG